MTRRTTPTRRSGAFTYAAPPGGVGGGPPGAGLMGTVAACGEPGGALTGDGAGGGVGRRAASEIRSSSATSNQLAIRAEPPADMNGAAYRSVGPAR